MLATTATAAAPFAAPFVGPMAAPVGAAVFEEPIEAYLPLVRRVALQVARRLPSSIDVKELIGAGTIGLVLARERYHPSLCERFATYAEIRIRGAILDQLREMDWMPRAARSKRKRYDATSHTLEQRLGRTPQIDEVACEMGLKGAQVDRLRSALEMGASSGFVDVDDCADETPSHIPGTEIERRQLGARLGSALELLSVRERELLCLYYFKGLRFREIGDRFGVTESRVCQLHGNIVSQLRQAMMDD